MKEEKKTLISLIGESDYKIPIIVGALNEKNLLDSYKIERNNRSHGINPEPLLTTREFNKIIKDYLNKKT
jgi:hypothetical protein